MIESININTCKYKLAVVLVHVSDSASVSASVSVSISTNVTVSIRASLSAGFNIGLIFAEILVFVSISELALICWYTNRIVYSEINISIHSSIRRVAYLYICI